MCDAVNGDALDDGSMLDDGGACGKVEDFVQTLGNVRELEFCSAKA